MRTMEELVSAIKDGKLEVVQSLLQQSSVSAFLNYLTTSDSYKGPDQNLGQYYTYDGHLLIHVAAKHGQTAIVRLLLQYFEVDVVTKRRETSMMLAALNNHEETLEFLLRNGANVHHIPVESNGRTVLIIACQNKLGNIVRILLQHRATILRSYFDNSRTDAAYTSFRKSVIGIINHGGRGIVELLLEYDNFNKDRLYKEILLAALSCKNVEMVQMILEKGLMRDGFIGTLSDCAALVTACSSIPLVQMLLDAGIAVNPPQDNDWSALHEAARSGSVKFAKILLENGADVNKFGKWLNSGVASAPLFYAMKRNSTSMFELLLEYGADIHIVNARKHNIARFVTNEKLISFGRILCMQIVKVHNSELLFVNERYLEVVKKSKELKAFAQKCKKEINRMRQQKFDDTTVSLYEVFVTKDLLRLAAFANNENILSFMKSREFTEKFPIYSDSIQKHLQKGCHRNYLTKRVCHFFLSLATRAEHALPRLPVACIEKIFDSFSNRDLESLRKSYF